MIHILQMQVQVILEIRDYTGGGDAEIENG